MEETHKELKLKKKGALPDETGLARMLFLRYVGPGNVSLNQNKFYPEKKEEEVNVIYDSRGCVHTYIPPRWWQPHPILYSFLMKEISLVPVFIQMHIK